MIQTLPKRSRQGANVISQVRVNYDRQCTECDEVIERGEDALIVYNTTSDGIPIAESGKLMHGHHLKEICPQLASQTARQMVGEF